ncbi:hypothetical protein FAM09_13325 [Niastella caeni]|uniref:Uncharacterized protein n=1 Tax=Niastella caeni TaxID=2569763 RepID=A0A4S8HXH1_9BACT|nr:hypothetical protein [Niastella caeni]THU39479.1 hypothetical protein FAM09_13325 [Niastella caeni]
MNDIRSSYIKVLPLIFLAGVVTAALQLYHDYRLFSFYPNDYNKAFIMEMPAFIVRNGLLWAGIGWVFKKWKQAAIAFSIVLLTIVVVYFLNKAAFMREYLFLRVLKSALLNPTFLPSLVFGFLCFGKRGLLYFLPLALFTFALPLLFQGSAFHNYSPYNTWYRSLKLDDLFSIQISGDRPGSLTILTYLYLIASVCMVFIIAGECFYAAAQNKSFKKIFRIDFAHNYTGPGAICLFYVLRLSINLLVIALYVYPLTYFHTAIPLIYSDQSVFMLIITIASGLLCLIAVVLYYRKFLVEYFISVRQKTSWLYWIVNIPLVGLLIFPVIVLISSSTNSEEDRGRFYFNDNLYYQKPYQILAVMIVLHLVGLLFSPAQNGSSLYWVFWSLELCLLIWYATAVTGYYLILAIGAAGFIVFLVLAYIAMHAYTREQPWSRSPLNEFNISLWLVGAFNLVNYTVLLPAFHLYKMKTIQKQDAIPVIETEQ